MIEFVLGFLIGLAVAGFATAALVQLVMRRADAALFQPSAYGHPAITPPLPKPGGSQEEPVPSDAVQAFDNRAGAIGRPAANDPLYRPRREPCAFCARVRRLAAGGITRARDGVAAATRWTRAKAGSRAAPLR